MPQDNRKKFCIITFASIHYALKAEKVLSEKRYKVKLIPIPRQISSDCGIALEFECQDKERITNIINNNLVVIENFHCV